MARRLTTQDKIKRARAEGYSRKQLANAFGVSVSAIGRAERGQTLGDTIKAQVDQFAKLGKRAKSSIVSGKSSLPSAKPKAAPRPKRVKEVIPVIVTPLERAAGALTQFDSDSKVVVYVKMSDGTTRVLYARGGIEVAEIGDLRAAIDAQEGRQYGGGKSYDWDDVVDITIEEY